MKLQGLIRVMKIIGSEGAGRSLLQVGLFCLGEIGYQFFVGLEEFLILIRDEQLKLLGELDLVEFHLYFYALGVAFLVEVLIVAAQEGEVQVGVVECIDRDSLFCLVLDRCLPLAFFDQTFLLFHKLFERSQIRDLTAYPYFLVLSVNNVLILEFDQTGAPQFLIVELITQLVLRLQLPLFLIDAEQWQLVQDQDDFLQEVQHQSQRARAQLFLAGQLDGPALSLNPFRCGLLHQHKQHLHFQVVLLVGTLTVVESLPDWVKLLLQKFVEEPVDVHLAAVLQHLVVVLVMGLEVRKKMFFGVDTRLQDDF